MGPARPAGRPRGLFEPSQLSPRTVLVAGLTALALAAAVDILWRSPFAVAVTLIAALLASALDHLVRWLPERIPRPLAIVLVMLAAVGLVAGVAFVLVPPTFAQAQAFVARAPDILRRFRESATFQNLDRRLHLGEELSRLGVPELLSELASHLVTALRDVLTLALAAVTVFFLVLFMLFYGEDVVRAWLSETSPERRSRYEHIARRTYHSLGGYIAGLFAMVGLNVGFTAVFLAIIGIPYNLALGLLSGLFCLIPAVGAISAGALLTLVALAAQGPWKAVATLVYYVVYQQVENHVFAPFIYQRTVKLNPLVTLVGVLFLTETWGLAGALVAVPVVAALQVVLTDVLELRRHRLGLPESPSSPGPVRRS